jgi:hypothetical protein
VELYPFFSTVTSVQMRGSRNERYENGIDRSSSEVVARTG